jgi:hypothetical protein
VVADVLAVATVLGGGAMAGGGRGGGGFGQRQQGGLDGGGVLDGAAPAQPDATGAVLGDREVAAEVGGAVLAVVVSLGLAFGAVGVDDVDQVARGRGWRSPSPSTP